MPLDGTLGFLAEFFFLAALALAVLLVRETREQFWLFFALSAFSLGLAQLLALGFFQGLAGLRGALELVGGFSFAYALLGLWLSFRRVRKHLQKKLAEEP